MLTITKIMLYILGGLALLLAVVLVWIASGNPGEQPTLQSTQVLQDTPNPVKVVSQLPTPTAFPTPNEEDRIASLSEAREHAQTETERLNRNKEIIVQLKGLITKANEKYTLPGWWHFITNREAFITASASFPNGEPIPTKTTLETWKFIDTDGYIDKSISLQDTGDLMTSSISLYKDGIRTYGTGETRKKEESLAAIGTSLLNELERNKDVIEYLERSKKYADHLFGARHSAFGCSRRGYSD